jgi:hypothetical protein
MRTTDLDNTLANFCSHNLVIGRRKETVKTSQKEKEEERKIRQ